MAKKTSSASVAPSRSVSVTGFLSRPIDAIKRDLEAMRQGLQALRASLPVEVTLSAEERRESLGKFGAAQLPEYRAVLDVVDKHPELFAALAARDGGEDDAKVETEAARQALAAVEALLPLVSEIDQFDTVVSDLRLAVGQKAREFVVAARAIAKANAAVNQSVREGMQAAEGLRPVAKGRKGKKVG